MLGLPLDTIDQSGKLNALRLVDIEPIVDEIWPWLADTRNREWLLIVDNHDDLENVKIADFSPTRLSGSVIITSRAQNSQRVGEVKTEVGIEIL